MDGHANLKAKCLTFTLLNVDVKLVQSSHGDLSDLWVQQELHQRRGDVLTGWHAGGLGHFTLKERQREGWGLVYLLHFVHNISLSHCVDESSSKDISTLTAWWFFFSSLQKLLYQTTGMTTVLTSIQMCLYVDSYHFIFMFGQSEKRLHLFFSL